MRSSSIVLAVALVSAVPAIAAPVPQPAARSAGTAVKAVEGKLSTEVLGFLAGIVGSITGKAAANTALGNNADGTPARRALTPDERSLASTLLKPLLKSAASSAAVEGFFQGIQKLFGGDSSSAAAAPAARDLSVDERSLASTLLKPLLKSAASSAAVAGFFGGIEKLFGGDSSTAPAQRRAAPTSGADLIAQIEGSSLFTQEQLDQVEADLAKIIPAGVLRRDLEARLKLNLGAVTKGLVGLIGSVAGSAGIDALFGGDDSSTAAPARRAAPTSGADLIAQIEGSSLFTQEQLDQVEADLSKIIPAGVLRRDLEARLKLNLGAITKGLVGLIGSVAGSAGIDALFGGDSNSARAYATGLAELD